jgi:hypothetical protein
MRASTDAMHSICPIFGKGLYKDAGLADACGRGNHMKTTEHR